MEKKAWLACIVTASMLVGGLSACSGSGERKAASASSSASKADDAALEQQLNGSGESFNSADVAGQAAKINLDQVQKAFWSTQGKDMNTWMSGFEKRVNEIYDGQGTVAIAGNRTNGNLIVAGFLDKNGTPGFQKGDERLFTIQQTGAVAGNQVPYSVSNGDGQPYYQGSHGMSGSGFLMGMMAGQLMSNWGGYNTPRSSYGKLSRYRESYKATPSFKSQQAENRQFQTRFKSSTTGAVESRRSMSGGTANQTGTSNRKWGTSGTTSGVTSGSTSGTTSGTSSWGGRRSTTTTGSGASSSSGSSSGSSSWGGRRSSGSSSSSGRRSSGGRRR